MALTPLLLAFFTLGSLQADTLFVGFNTATPVQLYSTEGTYQQDFGPSTGIAAIPAASNSYFVVQPDSNFTTSTVTQYTSNQTAISSFTVNGFIDDGAPGANNSLWLSAYNGTVYQVSATGAVETSWKTGYTHVGIASDGTYVYTTQGDTGNSLNKWLANGTAAGQIATPFTGLYGLGYDASTGDLWAGSTDYVYQLDTKGNLLSTLNLPGDSRTPDGAVHDGLEVGTFSNVASTVPEPASIRFFGLALLLASGIYMFRNRSRMAGRVGIAALSTVGAALGSVSVQLTASAAGSAPVGSTITWTAAATDTADPNASFTYQFSLGSSAGQMQIRRDFSPVNNYPWTPYDTEGNYTVQVVANSSSGGSGTAVEYYTVTSRVTGGSSVVSPTNHPLVALYSMPPCPAGEMARVRFQAPGDNSWQATSFKSCDGATSLNFYVGGMRASTTYTLQQDVYRGPIDTVGAPMSFTTGAIPAGTPIDNYFVAQAATAPNNSAYDVVLTAPNGAPGFATDTQGRIIWYLVPGNHIAGTIMRPVPGGTFLGIFNDLNNNNIEGNLIREYDLAGNVIRETNAGVISRQLLAMGKDRVNAFSHEAFRFPNGDTGVIATVERVADQGAGPVDVLGDMAIVLDSNLQVKWTWNEFDHLDLMRHATENETCTKPGVGCGPVLNPAYSVANDWTHSNSLAPTLDGNLIISVRHQDWVIKINYQDGLGDGSILWKLGVDGDFKANSSDSYPFFSHEHDAEFEPNGLMSVYDNGNTRIDRQGGNSRGQAWQIDEKTMTATPVVNVDLGVQSLATGSAQLLSNGNFHFYDGFINGNSSRSVEYTTSGALQFEQDLPSNNGYRSFRMKSLYTQN